jgi:DNA-binding MarR family transcriptional regulator
MADRTEPDATSRPDLAAMIVPVGRALTAAERPVLADHGLSMWAYVVLLHLDEHPIRTQAALADTVGADKTRIIAVLDDLAARGFISRQPDPADRRARLLSITEAGRRARDTAQAAIQQREEQLLARLTPAQRRGFLDALQTLYRLLIESPDPGPPA